MYPQFHLTNTALHRGTQQCGTKQDLPKKDISTASKCYLTSTTPQTAPKGTSPKCKHSTCFVQHQSSASHVPKTTFAKFLYQSTLYLLEIVAGTESRGRSHQEQLPAALPGPSAEPSLGVTTRDTRGHCLGAETQP